jgi:hypothetical protein
MKNLYKALFGLLILFSCTGCFEIVEQVSLTANGSGSYKVIANISQSKSNLNGIFAKDTLFGKPIPKISTISAKMEEAKNKMAQMPGISNVKLTKDFSNYVFNLTCDFKSVKDLDNALVKTIEYFDEKGRKIPTGNYAHDGTTFKRQVNYNYPSEVRNNMAGQVSDILAKAKFTAIYRFPTPVKSVSNPKAKISPSGKAVLLTRDFLSVAKSKEAIANTIVLK